MSDRIEPLMCSMGGIPFNKAHLDAKDATIATLRERLAEVERERNELRTLLMQEQNALDREITRAEAAEEANKRLRAETIEECAKAVLALEWEQADEPIKWNDIRSAFASRLCALASKKNDKPKGEVK